MPFASRVLLSAVLALLPIASVPFPAVAAQRHTPVAAAVASTPTLTLPHNVGASTAAALGALHHHQHHDLVAADDIARVATEEPRLVRVRGRFAQEPVVESEPGSQSRE